MITVPQIVEEILKNSPILSANFDEGLINYSSLARKLKPTIEKRLVKNVTTGSIVMALKRLQPKKSPGKSELSETLSKITDLSMRSNLASMAFTNSPTMLQNQSLLLEEASKTPNSFLTITHGIFETSIFLSRNLLQTAQEIFKDERLKLTTDNLSSITLILPKDAINTPGVHYSVFKKLFSNGVNVFETATSFTELTIFLEDESTEKAFAILKNLS